MIALAAVNKGAHVAINTSILVALFCSMIAVIVATRKKSAGSKKIDKKKVDKQ